VKGREAVARDGRGEDLAGLPGAVGGDDAAERIGALKFGVDLDGLRRESGGGERERD
jgi:hypothetical protein